MLTRYRGTEAMILAQVQTSDRVEDDKVVLDSELRYRGVLRGDPLDRILVVKDLAQIASIRGELGELMADTEAEIAEAEDSYVIMKARLYKSKAKAIKSGVLEGKYTDESINHFVRMDDEYANSKRSIRELKHSYGRIYNLHNGLLGVENALKKALEFTKDL